MEANKKLELIISLATAMSNCALYSTEHPLVHVMAEKAVQLLHEIIGDDPELSLMAIQNELIFNKEPLRERATHIDSFVRRLRRKGIEKVMFSKGLTVGEMTKFIEDLTGPDVGSPRYSHISTGFVEVRFSEGGLSGIPEDELIQLKNDQLEKVKDIYGGVSRFRQLDSAGLEDIVINFISVLKKESGILNVMSPVKTYSDFTYTHAANVTILSIFQAESLGITGRYLHDIGMAALLHDVGKLFVSSDILEKPGKLDSKEWEEMQNHTLYAARYLVCMENIPQIAIPVALEHHMGYDGSGYPNTRHVPGKQHLCTQIVAIADVYDAIRSSRPYKQGMGMEKALSILKQSAGTKFNSFLVDNFIKNISQVTGIAGGNVE